MGNVTETNFNVGAQAGYLNGIYGTTNAKFGARAGVEHVWQNGNYVSADVDAGSTLGIDAKAGHSFKLDRNATLNVYANLQAAETTYDAYRSQGTYRYNGQLVDSFDYKDSTGTINLALGAEMKVNMKSVGTIGFGAKVGNDYRHNEVEPSYLLSNGKVLNGVTVHKAGVYASPTLSFRSNEIGNTGLQVKAKFDVKEGDIALVYNIPHKKK